MRRLGIESLEDRRLLDGAAGGQAIELFSVSPALFVENQGQWSDESVRFVHQGDGVNVAMTDAGPVFQLCRVRETHQPQPEPQPDQDAADRWFDPLDRFDGPFYEPQTKSGTRNPMQ